MLPDLRVRLREDSGWLWESHLFWLGGAFNRDGTHYGCGAGLRCFRAQDT